MEMELKPFRWEDAFLIRPQLPRTDDNMWALKHHVEKGTGYTCWMDGEAIAAGGIDIFWNGVAEAWTMLGPKFFRHKIRMHRLVRDLLEDYIRVFRLHRVQMHIEAGLAKNIAWAKRLGFEQEGGPLLQFGPNKETYYMFRRLTCRS